MKNDITARRDIILLVDTFYDTIRKDPVLSHTHLHKLFPLTKAHFDHWNVLFVTTIDDLFEGAKAELAKQRALSISIVLQIKIAQTPRPEQLL
jgi:hemoglobin